MKIINMFYQCFPRNQVKQGRFSKHTITSTLPVAHSEVYDETVRRARSICLFPVAVWSVRLPEEALQERDRVERHNMMMSISLMYVKFLRCLEVSHRTVLPSLFTKPLPLSGSSCMWVF